MLETFYRRLTLYLCDKRRDLPHPPLHFFFARNIVFFPLFLLLMLLQIPHLQAKSDGSPSPIQNRSIAQAGAAFGSSLSTGGDVNGDGYDDLLIGAPDYGQDYNKEGAVFLFYGSENGIGDIADLILLGGQAGIRFGHRVATAGDVNGDGYSDILVASQNQQQSLQSWGDVFLFLGSPQGLNSVPDWHLESPQASAAFGVSLATAGDINADGYSDILISAPEFRDGDDKVGAVFLYLGSESSLNTSPDWTVKGDQVEAEFGASLATAGDVNADGFSDILIGAPLYDLNQQDEGMVYLYLGGPEGLSDVADWQAAGEQQGAEFGRAVSSAGDLNGDGFSDVALGAPLGKRELSGEGWVRLYLGSEQGLSQKKIVLAGKQSQAHFGTAVSFAGDHNGDGFADLVVGAPGYTGGKQNEGRLLLYHGTSNGIQQQPAWRIPANQQQARLGTAVGTAGDLNGDGRVSLLGGAPGFENEDYQGGLVSIYQARGAAPQNKTAWSIEGGQSDALLGTSVASAGDVNGDGFDDVLIGAPGFDGLYHDEGRALLFLGTEGDLSTTPHWILEGHQDEAGLGNAVTSAGDVNGDGYSDVLVSAKHFNQNYPHEGQVQLFLGSASGLSQTPAWRAYGGQNGAFFGSAIATAGDVNGDGYADVLIGASSYSQSQSGEGAAFLFLGGATGLAAKPAWISKGAQKEAAYGYAVSSAGDINQDGYSDVIISARLFDQDARDQGAAFVFLGTTTGLQQTPAWQAFGQQEGEAFGSAVAGLGDVNGDGFSDIAISSPFFDQNYKEEGRTFVYHGSRDGLPDTANWTNNGQQKGAEFGTQLATAGDVNGDGFSDLLVSASLFDLQQEDEGTGFLFLGGDTGLSKKPTLFNTENQSDARFGGSIATAGDVNGDGYADIMVGSPRFDGSRSNEGASFLYYGNNSQGLATLSRQVRDNPAYNIAPLGRSDRANRITLSVFARSAFARVRVKMEWELKEVGQNFNGKQTQTSTDWTLTERLGTVLNTRIGGLKAKTQYHWRLRLRYDPVTSPFQSHSRWLSQKGVAWQESHFRTPPDFLRTPKDGIELLQMDPIFTWNNINLDNNGSTTGSYLFCLKTGTPHFDPKVDCTNIAEGEPELEFKKPLEANMLLSFVSLGGLLGLALTFRIQNRIPFLRRISRSIQKMLLLLILVACSNNTGAGQKSPPPSPSSTLFHQVFRLKAETQYHWKVFALDAQNQIHEESETRSFKSP